MRNFSRKSPANCLHEARGSNAKLPKVGDWVAVKLVANEEKAMIQAILPRRTQLCPQNDRPWQH